MPRLDKKEVIIMEFAIPQATLMRANMKNTVLIALALIARETKKCRMYIDL